MATPDLIGPLPGTTPISARPREAAGRKLPPDLLRDASRRLAIMALLAAVLWIVATTLGHLSGDVMSGGKVSWTRVDITDAIAAGSALLSLALFAYIRRSTRDPQFVLDLGLVYLVTTALALGLMVHWGPVPEGIVIYPQISWIGAVILIFAAIVPNSPWKVFVASLIAASMNPLGMIVGRMRGIWTTGSLGGSLLMHYPDYLLVGVAVLIAHVVTKLGREVTRAREMGSYRLGDLIGRGGMGEVYRATHRMLARPAAIKLIRPEALAASSGGEMQLTLKRFRREAEAAANLRSPHTVEIYDFGTAADGTLYFVMELLEGMDLETLVTRHGAVPAARAIHILEQVCESLEEAHAAGLVHRDIKPANIYVGPVALRHDFVKVLDFGLVKPTTGHGDGHSLATAEGLTPGTPAYMAPEMALGEVVDGRADVYALGCVAYFLLTGALVFEADSALQMIARHLRAEPVPPSRRTTQRIPPALEQLVLDCLGKEAARRPDATACRKRLRAAGEVRWEEEQAIRWWSEVGAPGGTPRPYHLPFVGDSAAPAERR
ncbi:MAG TPA: serine/threonine-protein kinase [Gemmatimonadaceae bacterium]|nr:serine/threonine-protein kinase [Gemmatimonadaceae bacterium]